MAPFPLNIIFSGHPTGSFGDPISGYGRGRQQLGPTKEIIRCTHQESSQAGSHNAFMTCFAKPSRDLHPSKNFFYPLSDPLAGFIGLMPSGSTINRRSPSPFRISGHMGGNLPATQSGHKITGIVPLVGPQGFGFDPSAGLPFEHGQGRFLLRNPNGRRNQQVQQQSMPVLQQGMGTKTQPRSVSQTLAQQT